MRRPPTTPDTRETTAASGASRPSFDRAYRELVTAWNAREDLRGDTERIPALDRASRRLDQARLEMSMLRITN